MQEGGMEQVHHTIWSGRVVCCVCVCMCVCVRVAAVNGAEQRRLRSTEQRAGRDKEHWHARATTCNRKLPELCSCDVCWCVCVCVCWVCVWGCVCLAGAV